MNAESRTGVEPRGRFRFTLKTLLLFFIGIALVVGAGVNTWRLRTAERELNKLRNEAGYLSVSDRTKVHVIALEVDDPRTWKWRMFVPKGHKYQWRLAQGSIPLDSAPTHGITGISNEPYWDSDGEVLITAKLSEADDGDWRLSVSSKRGDSKDQMGGATLTIPRDDLQWMSTVPATDGRVLGGSGAVAVDPAGPIVLLQRRACEKQPDGSYKPSTNPMPGFMLWLEER
ncbi:MAG: hypothetical protein HYX69_18855 [Planctomycetia bacterium]|nr:hypothetical protein [Planctomycetia bacterium]